MPVLANFPSGNPTLLDARSIKFEDGTTLQDKLDNGELTGTTPIKGVDYWTAEDKAEIIDAVLAAIEGTFWGEVSSDNTIVLAGVLADGTYNVKYEMQDGSTIDIGELVLGSDAYYSITSNLTNCTSSNSAKQVDEGNSYNAIISANEGYSISSIAVTMGGTDVTASAVNGSTISITNVTGDIVITAVAAAEAIEVINQIPISTDADGNLFNGGQGWKTDYRLSLSSGNETAASGYECTGFIPVKYGDVIRIKNIDVTNENSTNIVSYDSSKTAIKGATTINGTTLYNLFVEHGTEENGVYTATLTSGVTGAFTSDLAYIRIGSKSITDESILTINQEIA